MIAYSLKNNAVYFYEVMYLFVSMFNNATALLFLLLYLYLDTVFLYMKIECKCRNKCSDERSFGPNLALVTS